MALGFENEVEMKTAQQLERIYRVWSSRQEEQIAVRIQYSVVEERRHDNVLSRRARGVGLKLMTTYDDGSGFAPLTPVLLPLSNALQRPL